MFGQDRNQLRQMFFTAWRKHLAGVPTEPLETQIIRIIVQHPEYHVLLTDESANLERDYTPEMGETNPFLHMAMHLALQDQITTGRPPGVTEVYTELINRNDDPHQVEHEMMECLAEMIWQSQRNGTMPDEAAYMECLRQQSKRP
jgi:hypothetical protein